MNLTAIQKEKRYPKEVGMLSKRCMAVLDPGRETWRFTMDGEDDEGLRGV